MVDGISKGKPKTRSQGPLQLVPWSENVGRVGEDPGNDGVGKKFYCTCVIKTVIAIIMKLIY